LYHFITTIIKSKVAQDKIKKGNEHYNKGDYKKALKEYEHALYLDKNNTKIKQLIKKCKQKL